MPLSPEQPFSWQAGPGHPVPLSPVDFYAPQQIACAPCCALPSPVSLSPQQPVVCLSGLPLRNINSAILSQPDLHHPVQADEAEPFLPILEFCLRGSAAPPRASKEGRVHCIALPGCNAAHCGAKRGRHPCNAKCSFLLRSRVEWGMALQRGERGGRALVT